MANYRKLDKDGKPVGRYSRGASNKPMEGFNRFVQDTPTFESLVTKGGQGTRGDKTFAIGAKEYERNKKTSEKKQDSKDKPASKKPPAAKSRPEDTMSEKDKAYFRRKMQEEEMMRKMGQRYDEIMPNPEFAMGGMAQKKMSKVMKEYKAGTLHSGKGGKVVKSPKQAVAIGLSEARRMKK
jgi:hypothetical protein